MSEKPRDLHRQLVMALERRGVRRVLDVGANTGQYARRLRHAGWDGDIVSFEPLPDAHAGLAAAAADDPRWHVPSAVAVGSERGRARLQRSLESDMSSLRPQTAELAELSPTSAVRDEVEVEVRPLAELVAPEEASGLFVKIDVQGFEDAVLDGIGELWSAVAGLQLELALTQLYEGERPYLETCRRLESLGYRLAMVLPGYFDRKLARQLQFDGVFFREPG